MNKKADGQELNHFNRAGEHENKAKQDLQEQEINNICESVVKSYLEPLISKDD